MNQRWQLVGVFAVVVLVALTAYFWNLGVSSIANADEGVHALVTRELRESGDWLTLHIRGVEYFRKPPLSFWIRGVTQLALGENEFATRLPSALAGAGTTLLIAWWAWLWTRRWPAALVAGVMFPLLPVTFTHTFRTGETDGLLIFFLTLAAWLFWRSVKTPWLVVPAAGVIGLAFMTKSVAAGVVPIGFMLTLWLQRKWPYTWKHVVLTVVLFLAVILPWHVYEYAKHGQKFWNEYVGYHILQRVEERLHVTPKTHGPFWYPSALERGMFPWSWLVVPALALAIVRVRKREDDAFVQTFLLAWGVGTVVLFSLAATKLAWYIAPAYPALTLLLARFLTQPFWSLPRWLLVLSVAAAVGYLMRVTQQFQTGASKYLSFDFLPAWVSVSAMVVVAAGVLTMAYRKSTAAGQRTLKVMALLLVLHMALVSAALFSRNVRRIYDSPFRVFRNEAVARDPKANVYIYDIGYYTSPLAHLYLVGPRQQRILTPLREQPDKLQEILASRAGAFVIFEKTREHELEGLADLEKISEFGSLALYRVR